jgi:hypothetical protein
MGHQVVYSYSMILTKVPSTLVTPYSYPMGHHSHWFVSKNGQKRLKTGFWGYLPPYPLILHSNMFYGQQVVFNYPMLLPKVSATLNTPHSYLMGNHSHSFVSKNGRKRWKTVFWGNSYHNLLFCTQICSMGQWVVFIYPMILPKVPTTLVTPYSYPIRHHSHSFVSKNGQKRLKTGFWGYLPP